MSLLESQPIKELLLRVKMEVVSEDRVNFHRCPANWQCTGGCGRQDKAEAQSVHCYRRVSAEGNAWCQNTESELYIGTGTVSCGIMPATSYLGMSDITTWRRPAGRSFSGTATGIFFDRAVTNNWLSTDTLLNTPASYNNRKDLSYVGQVEPFPGMRIDVSADRRFLEGSHHIILLIKTDTSLTVQGTGLWRGASRFQLFHGVRLLKRSQRITIISRQLSKHSEENRW